MTRKEALDKVTETGMPVDANAEIKAGDMFMVVTNKNEPCWLAKCVDVKGDTITSSNGDKIIAFIASLAFKVTDQAVKDGIGRSEAEATVTCDSNGVVEYKK